MFLVILLFFTGVPTLLGESLDSVLKDSSINPREQADLKRLFTRADVLGIPAELLLPRLKEGIAKRVSARRIHAALDQEIQRLQQAQDIVLRIDEGARLLQSRAAWQRSANLLAWGAEAEEIETLVSACTRRIQNKQLQDYGRLSDLFVSLVRWGLTREAALMICSATGVSQLPGKDFPGVLELLILGRRDRIPVERLVETLKTELPQTRDISSLEEKLFYD